MCYMIRCVTCFGTLCLVNVSFDVIKNKNLTRRATQHGLEDDRRATRPT